MNPSGLPAFLSASGRYWASLSLLSPTTRDLAALRPDLRGLVDHINRVVLSNLDAPAAQLGDILEIHVNRGAGFRILALCTFGGAIDITPFPSVPVIWSYKAIYRVDGVRVGHWSDLLSLQVTSITQP